MKQVRQLSVFFALLGTMVWFLADSAQVRSAAAEALSLCARSVIPALFPFLALSSMLVRMGFANWITPWCSGWMTTLFRLPGCAAGALVLGLIAGYPVGARTAGELYRARLLTREEAQRLIAFCNNSNPVFLISVLGGGVFHSTRVGLWLWLIHVASALLTGIFFRGGRRGGWWQRNKRQVSRQPDKQQSGRRQKDRQQGGWRQRCGGSVALPPTAPPSLSEAFVASVRSAGETMLFLCAFVTFFYVLVAPLSALGTPVGAVLTGVLELFSLTPLLADDAFSFVLAAGCSGWGGLCVMCQTAAVLGDSGLSLRPCILGKLVQGVLSALLAILLSGHVFS